MKTMLEKKQKQAAKGKKNSQKGSKRPVESEGSTVKKDYALKIDFGKPSVLHYSALSVSNLSFSYQHGVDILQNVNFGMQPDTRVTIVGANGSGKSTFLKLVTQQQMPSEVKYTGEINCDPNLRIAYFSQHSTETLPMDTTPVDYLKSIDNNNLSSQDIRKILGTIGLESNLHMDTMSALSGGQKVRVALASCQMMNPHMLVMDEPTNHLDIESINGLISGINSYEGGVLLVTHNKQLITETNCELWVCADKTLTKFDGDCDDYSTRVLSDLEE